MRHREVVPRLAGTSGGQARWSRLSNGALVVDWTLGDGGRLTLLANLNLHPVDDLPRVGARCVYAQGRDAERLAAAGRLPPWSAAWYIESGGAA